MKTFTSALLRALIAAGVPMAILWALDSRLNPEQGPDIGGGFVLLLALFTIPLAWGWRDGRHDGPRSSLAVWAVAAALVLVAEVARFVTSGGFGTSDAGEALFLAAFVTGPFLAGGCLGAVLGGSTFQASQRP